MGLHAPERAAQFNAPGHVGALVGDRPGDDEQRSAVLAVDHGDEDVLAALGAAAEVEYGRSFEQGGPGVVVVLGGAGDLLEVGEGLDV